MELGSPYGLGLLPALLIFWMVMKRVLKKRAAGQKRAIALESLSQLWKAPNAKNETEPILSEAACGGTPEIPPVFQHEEITLFYQNHIQALKGTILILLKEVLLILDREGDCPSVVNTKGEAEAPLCLKSTV